METEHAEINRLRELATANARDKAISGAAIVFAAYHKGYLEHQQKCYVCRINVPTLATCGIGYASLVNANSYFSDLVITIKE